MNFEMEREKERDRAGEGLKSKLKWASENNLH